MKSFAVIAAAILLAALAAGSAIPKSEEKVPTLKETDDVVASLRKELKMEPPAAAKKEEAKKKAKGGKAEKTVGEVTPGEACAIFVERFYTRMEETRPRSYRAPANPEISTGPGAPKTLDWIEESLGDKGRSESRLVEITDSLCHSKDNVCQAYVEEHIETIELWWRFRGKKDRTSDALVPSDLFVFLCVNHLRLACPRGSYGPDCLPCPRTSPDTPVCSGRGGCFGDGTRSGNGTCVCAQSHKGAFCEECNDGFYELTVMMVGDNGSATKAPGPIRCERCHEACKQCTGPNDDECLECSEGHIKAENGTCVDLNECDDENHGCPLGTYCRNTKGSRACTVCDHACDHKLGCTAGGPEGCVGCREGYRVVEGKGCTVINNCHDNHDCKHGEYCVHEGPAEHSCQGCHKSCNGCIDAGPKNCTACAEGYMRIDTGPEDRGRIHCFDKNECNDFPCKFPEVCQNLEGSYRCICAKTHKRTKDGVCIKKSDDELAAEKEAEEKDKAEAEAAAKGKKPTKGAKKSGDHDEL